MRRDSRLSGVLHVLLHMAEAKHPITSEALAQAMNTNPVVVRRVMAGLRDAGMVRSEKGHGGGWQIACDLATTSLHDVYVAIGAPYPFALENRNESPGCLVELAVNEALDAAFEQAQALLISELKQLSLATLAEKFHAHYARVGGPSLEHMHDPLI